MTTWLL